MENKKDIGKAFREKLDGLQKSPSNAVWDSIRADLPKKRNRFLFLFWSNATQVTKTLLVVALLALVTTASYFIYDNYSDANNSDVNNSKNNNASGTAPSGTYDNSNASSGNSNNNNTGNATTDNNSDTNNNTDANNADAESNTGDGTGDASAESASKSGNNNNSNSSGRSSTSKNKNNNGVAGSDGSSSDNNANRTGTSKNNRNRNAASNRVNNANGEDTASAKAKNNNRNSNKTYKSNNGLVNGNNGTNDSSTGTSTANNNRNTKNGKTGRKTNTPGTNPANNNGGGLTGANGTSKGNNAKGGNANNSDNSDNSDNNNNNENAKSGNALSTTSQGKTAGANGTPTNGNSAGKSDNNSGTANTTTDSNNSKANTDATTTAQNNEGATTATNSLNNAVKDAAIALKDSIPPAIDSLAIAMAKDSATICEPTIDDAKKADSTATAPYKKWYVFAHAAPTKYNLPGGTSLIDPTLNGNSTTLSSSFNYGIYAGYNFSPKLSVRLGIIKAGLGQTTKNASLFSNYSVVPGNSAEPNGYVELQLPENYGGINYRSGVSNAGVMQQLHTEQDTVTFNIKHKLELYEVPIEATYTLFGKKVGVSISAGASGIFVKQNSVYAQNAQGSVLLGSLKGINKVSFSGNVGLSFYYRFIPNLQVNIEPVFKYYFNTFDAIKPTSVGLQIGLQYNFDIGKQKK
jgi:hypothetical protein